MIRLLEKFLFASRWLLAPLYVALAVSLVAVLVKAAQHLWEMASHLLFSTEADVILGLLALVDLTLTGALVVIVIFSGYGNFISRIDPSEHNDWPEWMARIDFTGLKLKLMSTIVAISAIQLLKAFMDIHKVSDRDLSWYVGIHLVFVVSCLMLAFTDRLGEDHHTDKT